MVDIDVKDKKILYHLDVNSRQSYRSIGRKVGLSKDTVAYRIKKLQEKGIITRFSTIFDYLRLGLIPLRFYFRYQYVTPEIRKEIIDHFVNCKYSTVVCSIEGSYDLIVLMLVKNVTDIYPFWKKTLDEYRDYFAHQVYSNYMGESIYRKSFLLDEKDDDRTKNILRRGGKKVEYDDLDFQIVQIIASNARMPTTEIAKKLDRTVITVNNRIKKLIELEVILGFKVEIDVGKLGYQWSKVDIYLREYDKIRQITKYIETNPYLYTIDYTLGYADLELEFYLKNINHLHQIMDDVSTTFPKIIRSHTYFQLIENHKWFKL